MLKFLFLGANGSLQDLTSGNTSLLISGDKGVLCVDLSCNIAKVVDADVDAVLLTHEHIDHVYALPSLLHQLWLSGRTRELIIIVPEGMAYIPEGMLDLFRLRSKKGMFNISIVSGTRFELGTMHIETFKTDHTANSVGLTVIEGNDKLVYTCDTRPIGMPPAIMDGARVLIHEASGVRGQENALVEKGHSSGANAAELAAKLGVDRLYLCHLPKGIDKMQRVWEEACSIFSETCLPEVLVEYTV